MTARLFIRYFLLVCISLFLIWLSLESVAGGIDQFPRSSTAGQHAETLIQFLCGVLSLLTLFSCYWRHKWVKPVRIAWAVSLTMVAGLFSLVWGPPLPLTALAFSATALLIALAILWVLGRLDSIDGDNTEQGRD